MDNSRRYNMKMVNKYSTKEFEEKYTYTGDDLGEKVLFGVYISKRVVQKMGSWLPHDI